MTVHLEKTPVVPRVRVEVADQGRRREWLVLLALLFSATNLHAVTLFRYPRPMVDEVELVGRAWNLVRFGQNLSPIIPIAATSQTPPVEPRQLFGSWIYALVVEAFGPDLWAVRMESLAFGVLLLLAVYFTGRRLYGPAVGYIAVVLVSLSEAFVLSSHLARYDIVVAAAGFGAIALVLHDHEAGFPARSILGGVLIGLVFEMHGSASLYGPVVMAMLFVAEGTNLLRSRRAYGFAAGACVGLMFFLWVHVVPWQAAGANGMSDMLSSSDSIHRPPFMVVDLQLWFRSAADTIGMVLGYAQARAPLVAVALPVLAIRHEKPDQHLLMLFGTLFAESVAILSYKTVYYEILFSPATDLLIAAFLVILWKWIRRERTLVSHRTLAALDVGLATCLALLVLSVVGSLAPLRGNAKADYDRATEALRNAVTPGSTLVGDYTYWFGLTDHHFVSSRYLASVGRDKTVSSLSEGFRRLRGDYLITGIQTQSNLTYDDPASRPLWARNEAISKREWDKFIAEHSVLVTSLETPSLGEVRVYRIRGD